jgi:hypothetical protein
VSVDDAFERALSSGLVQPDPTTCGSCVLVVSRLLHDPDYADALVEGTKPLEGGGGLQERFAQEALAMHRVTSGTKDGAGRLQLPWPGALGTRPWALAREMTHKSGERGSRYVVRPVPPRRRLSAFDRIAALAAAGQAVPLYVGNRWCPRHVVLALPGNEGEGRVRVYDPADGRRYPVAAEDFAAGRLDVAGWKVPWAAVMPRG